MNIRYEPEQIPSSTESRYELQQFHDGRPRNLDYDAESFLSTLPPGDLDTHDDQGEFSQDSIPFDDDNGNKSPLTSDDSLDLDLEDLADPAPMPTKHDNEALLKELIEPTKPFDVVLEGKQVYFPRQPYKVQEAFMREMIKGIEHGKHCLLESPTGTGKTLSLLCAALAVQNSTEGKTKIIYTTRTHQQIRNVIDELKRVRPYYPHVKFAVLGAKQHCCVNEKVAKYRGTRYFDSMCKIKVGKKACKFYGNTMRMKTVEEEIEEVIKASGKLELLNDEIAKKAIKKEVEKKRRDNKKDTNLIKEVGKRFAQYLDKVRDIEDLRVEGIENTFCPYFMQIALKDLANFLIVPYDYIFDPLVLDTLEINIKDCVLIVDEAHNLKKKAEDGLSFEVNIKDFDVMHDDLDALKHKIRKYEKARSEGLRPPLTFKTTLEDIEYIKYKINRIRANFKRELEKLKAKHGRAGNNDKFTPPKTANGRGGGFPGNAFMNRFHNDTSQTTYMSTQAGVITQTQQPLGNYFQTSRGKFGHNNRNSTNTQISATQSPYKRENSGYDEEKRNVGEALDGKVIFDIFELSSSPSGSNFYSRELLQEYVTKMQEENPGYNPMGIIDTLKRYLDSNQHKKELPGIAAIGEAVDFMLKVDHAWKESLYVPMIERKIKLMLECIEKLLFLFQKDILGGIGNSQRADHFSYINAFKTYMEYSPDDPNTIKISLWCFHAAPYMRMLEDRKPTAFMFASGTLTPFNFYEFELGLRCDYKLNNAHVIDSKKQIYSAVINKTAQGTDLKFTYENRKDEKTLLELGDSIVNFVQVIPNGVVVFFASYDLLYQCKRLWSIENTTPRKTSIFTRISQKKKIYFEPKSTTQMNKLMEEFKEDANSEKGAILFAVFRGKASEGMNFSDNMARSVMIVGIPYPPLYDPKITLKKNYLNSIKDTPNMVKPIRGDEWYEMEALVAVNQAVGRVIRHKNDFGTILYYDLRYSQQKFTKYLPKWVLDNFDRSEQYGAVIKKLSGFLHQNPYRFPEALPPSENERRIEEKEEEKHEPTENPMATPVKDAGIVSQVVQQPEVKFQSATAMLFERSQSQQLKNENLLRREALSPGAMKKFQFLLVKSPTQMSQQLFSPAKNSQL